MKTFVIAAVALTSSLQAHAVYRPGWERPVMSAEMKILSSRYGFQEIAQANLTLTHRDEVEGTQPTGMVLELIDQHEILRTYELAITDVRDAGCGSVQYSARLHQEEPVLGARFSVTLVDHSRRICEDYRPFVWEASVRSGFGFCGTMDATLELGGNPEPVITPASVE